MRTHRLCLTWLIPTVLSLASTAVTADDPAKQQPQQPWAPEVVDGMPEKWDWIQLTSLEWLKGEFVGLYNDSLEFESHELDTLTLDWSDVKRVRTARRMEMQLRGRVEVRGRLFVEDDLVRILPRDGPEQDFKRSDLLTATIGSPHEIDHWKMSISVGGSFRTGNTNVTEVNGTARFIRRSAQNRLTIDFIGNYNVTEDELVSDNQRATITWDRFVGERVFWTPIAVEYFRDPFQNISLRSTYSVGAGYHLIDGKKAEWDLSGGPGFQRTMFDNVAVAESESASTPAFTVSSVSDVELTGWLDFLTEYRFQFNNEESGSYNHHMMVSLETDITKLLDFDISWVWDRIQNPRPDSDGVVPKQDDLRLIVSVEFDF
jgi:putative salt-induced outer membrane protein YdiY